MNIEWDYLDELFIGHGIWKHINRYLPKTVERWKIHTRTDIRKKRLVCKSKQIIKIFVINNNEVIYKTENYNPLC